ncbi:MAG: DUF2281 domain-containing protein [Aridibacter sp.]
MIVTKQVTEKLQKLPISAQEEVLHFIEFLTQRFEQEADEDKQWSDFSLAQSMKGLENDELPEYTEEDLKEKWQ